MHERFPTRVPDLTIRYATRDDVPVLLSMIRELAEFEELLHVMQASEAELAQELFPEPPAAEALPAQLRGASPKRCLRGSAATSSASRSSSTTSRRSLAAKGCTSKTSTCARTRGAAA